MTAFLSPGLSRRSRVSPRKWFALTVEGVAHEQRHRCFYCHEPLGRREITGDHIVPKSKGGAQYSRDNLVVACRPCTQTKGSLDAAVFLKAISAPRPLPGMPHSIWMAWLRRRLFMRTERAVRHIAASVGIAA